MCHVKFVAVHRNSMNTILYIICQLYDDYIMLPIIPNLRTLSCWSQCQQESKLLQMELTLFQWFSILNYIHISVNMELLVVPLVPQVDLAGDLDFNALSSFPHKHNHPWWSSLHSVFICEYDIFKLLFLINLPLTPLCTIVEFSDQLIVVGSGTNPTNFLVAPS